MGRRPCQSARLCLTQLEAVVSNTPQRVKLLVQERDAVCPLRSHQRIAQSPPARSSSMYAGNLLCLGFALKIAMAVAAGLFAAGYGY